MPDLLAELAIVRRSGVTESRHFGCLLALHRDGSVAMSLGDPDALILPRSTVKPAQALACLTAGAPLVKHEIAIAAGSHTGEDEHVRVVRELLERAGVGESALGCPADWPENAETRERLIRDGEGPSPIRMNCSGKHAAMILAAATNGWDIASYLDPQHPLQQHVREAIVTLTGVPVEHDAIDGCGAPLFSTTVRGIATAFQRLVLAEEGSPEFDVAWAMRTYPYYVGGTNHQNSLTMTLVPGTLAKGGAEGVIGIAAASGESVSMKVIDGSPRATTLIGLDVLGALGVDISAADALLTLPVLGGGVRVGEIAAGSDLEAAMSALR
ncbi:asparaginase [Glaciihabitans sp. UYNi722]|uniref:asparaginase n=1 Tax=Glaciihabitans sp. UYNi722 TaxID=3156344 RepID=UPI00339A147F